MSLLDANSLPAKRISKYLPPLVMSILDSDLLMKSVLAENDEPHFLFD